MKYLGLDLGSKTLGIAISDTLGMLARSYETYRFKEDDYNSAIRYTIEVCKKEAIDEVVLGLPKHMNGDTGIRAEISFSFQKNLEKAGIKTVLEDERLTTVLVDKAMISGNVRRKARKEKKDEMAAVVILQNYLDKKRF